MGNGVVRRQRLKSITRVNLKIRVASWIYQSVGMVSCRLFCRTGTKSTHETGLQMNANGQLVTTSGYAIEPAITIPTDASAVDIGTDVGIHINNAQNRISCRYYSVSAISHRRVCRLRVITFCLKPRRAARHLQGQQEKTDLGQFNQDSLKNRMFLWLPTGQSD